jgi:Icc protein
VRPTPSVEVFAVDDSSVQLTWRGLRPGLLRLRAADARAEVEVDHGPGAALLEGLPPGRLLTVTASGPAVDGTLELPARTLEALPGEELCRVATISDLHLGIRGFGHRGTIVERPRPEVPHPIRCAEAAVREAEAWGAERMLVKGDITNAGQVGQWRAYAELVRGSSLPFDALAGNHDRAFSPGSRHLLPEDAARAFDLSVASPVMIRDLRGLRVVMLDSTRPNQNRGQLDDVVDHVLDAVHDAPRGGGVLVVLHHQLQPHRPAEVWPVGIRHGESLAFLARLGAAHPHVLVTSGHTHRHRRWGHAGVTTTQVGATKDYPGVWGGYVVHEGGMRQIVRRIARPDVLAWTDHTRRAAYGAWRWVAPGRLDSRCFNLRWTALRG